MSYEFTGTVETVEVKKSKNGKTYYRLNIPQGGSDRWHSSFDSKVVDLQGETINFDAEKTKYGWNLKEYEVVTKQQATPTSQTPTNRTPGSSRSNQENAWIACQGMINRGIEVGFFRSAFHALVWFSNVYPVLQAIWAGDHELVNEKLQELALDLEEEGRMPGEEG